jgi:hypothetical protein
MLSDPDTVVEQAAAYSRKRALSFVYTAVAGGAFAAFALYQWYIGEGRISDWVVLAWGALAIVLGTHRAAYCFGKARQLRAQIEESRK